MKCPQPKQLNNFFFQLVSLKGLRNLQNDKLRVLNCLMYLWKNIPVSWFYVILYQLLYHCPIWSTEIFAWSSILLFSDQNFFIVLLFGWRRVQKNAFWSKLFNCSLVQFVMGTEKRILIRTSLLFSRPVFEGYRIPFSEYCLWMYIFMLFV